MTSARSKTGWIAAAAIIVLAAGGGAWLTHRPMTQGVLESAALATPSGITLQETKSSYGAAASANTVLYADAKGMALYTYDKDIEPGKTACTGDCAKAWPPAVVLPGAAPFGDWSIVARDDGAKQWAYRGKPLYSFAKDTDVADPKGDGAVDGVWHTAWFKPAVGIGLPSGVGVQDAPAVAGEVFTDTRGMTLYVFDGDPKNDRQACPANGCAGRWEPLPAAGLANPVGDFSIVARDDGSHQWAYKSRPLYTFDGDRLPGDANGANLDRQWQVAMLTRYFTPADIAIQRSPGVGAVLTAADGMTLYKRDGYRYAVGTHNTHIEGRGVPSMGRAIGTAGCDAECTRVWHPMVAPADAQPSGFWGVATREDGTRQWSYRGYPLYRYAGDKKPGDMIGNDIYDLLISDGVHKVATFNSASSTSIPAPPTSMNWVVALP